MVKFQIFTVYRWILLVTQEQQQQNLSSKKIPVKSIKAYKLSWVLPLVQQNLLCNMESSEDHFLLAAVLQSQSHKFELILDYPIHQHKEYC